LSPDSLAGLDRDMSQPDLVALMTRRAQSEGQPI
jgi:hypothetical protein